jgi:hypothetical protein
MKAGTGVDDPGQVVFGHYTTVSGWIIDKAASVTIGASTDHTFSLTAQGNVVGISLDGVQRLTNTYFSLVTEGAAGVFSKTGTTYYGATTVSVDDITVVTSNAAASAPAALAAAAAPTAAVAGGGSILTDASLEPIVQEAINRWSKVLKLNQSQLAQLNQVNFQIADLTGLTLGQTAGNTITLDADAAGYGWFIDSTPGTHSEFTRRHDKTDLFASTSSPAFGDMDLLTVVTHELGHVLGYGDQSPLGSIMDSTLSAGERLLTSPLRRAKRAARPAQEHQAHVFDEKSGDFISLSKKHGRAEHDHAAALRFDAVAWTEAGKDSDKEKNGWIVEV